MLIATHAQSIEECSHPNLGSNRGEQRRGCWSTAFPIMSQITPTIRQCPKYAFFFFIERERARGSHSTWTDKSTLLPTCLTPTVQAFPFGGGVSLHGWPLAQSGRRPQVLDTRFNAANHPRWTLWLVQTARTGSLATFLRQLRVPHPRQVQHEDSVKLQRCCASSS